MKTAKIRLTRGYVALIDARDAEWACERLWYASLEGNSVYADTNTSADGKRRPVGLHRLVYEKWHGPIPDGLEIDHKNRNSLDNRLSNLRLVTHGANSANRDVQKNRRYKLPKGVYPNHTRFMSRIQTNGKDRYLGTFDTPEQAAAVFQQAWTDLHAA